MITEQAEVARYRVAEQIRAAEAHALLKESKEAGRPAGSTGPRHELAGVLRRWADWIEPEQRRRSTGLSVVR
jgi:hypothetical protein